MTDVSIGSYDDKLIRNQRVAVKLALITVLANVVGPFHPARFLVEGANYAIARANEQEVTDDRGSGKNSAACVKFPEGLWLSGR